MITRPILFSGAMVRALLDGSKTQTRRALKVRCQEIGERDDGSLWPWSEHPDKAADHWHASPYGQPGDRLWVRETFGYVSPDEFERPHAECNIEYRADLAPGCTDRPGQWPADECAGDPARPRWRPSIHMPRAASRILLEIVSVRVERLQDISAADARAEGVRPDEVRQISCFGLSQKDRDALRKEAAVRPYTALWESINGAGSWEANPWVWVVEFKRAML